LTAGFHAVNCVLEMLNFAAIVRHVSPDLAVYHCVQPETMPFWVGADGGTPAHVVALLTGTEVELVCVLELDEETTGFERYFILLELPELSVQL
jgi:hypothetical protein